MSHPLPTHPSISALPLQIGEAVYKLIANQDKTNLKALCLAYKHMPPETISNLLSVNGDHYKLIKRKTDGSYARISTTFLGYIASSRVVGGWEGDTRKYNNYNLTGYDVRWQTTTQEYIHFEDESVLIPLRDIIILSQEQLVMELTCNVQKGKTT